MISQLLGNNEFGSSTALPIWLNYMEEIIDDIEYGIQPRPSGLIAKKINLNDGSRQILKTVRLCLNFS